jgi:hypothetical protein
MDFAALLLTVHIIGGVTAVLAALVAFSAKTWDAAHRWHVYAGTVFFWSMALVTVTAVSLALIADNVFLLLIAFFSFYLAWSGWRYARRRQPAPKALDRLAAVLMAATALAMIAYGLAMLGAGRGLGVALAVFGVIGAAFCAADLLGRTVDARARIAGHLTRMLAAATTTLTAILVTNISMEPAVVIWLLPTVVITPLIAWWNRRIMNGFKPRSMSS